MVLKVVHQSHLLDDEAFGYLISVDLSADRFSVAIPCLRPGLNNQSPPHVLYVLLSCNDAHVEIQNVK